MKALVIQVLSIIVRKMINKLKILFTHNELIQSINLIVFLIIVLIFEVFGIAIFIPVLSILLEQEFDSSNTIIKSINDFFFGIS